MGTSAPTSRRLSSLPKQCAAGTSLPTVQALDVAGTPRDAAQQYALGRAFWHGNGVGEDREQAAVWLRRAAEQGHADAQLWLGRAYEFARGVEQDKAQAVAW